MADVTIAHLDRSEWVLVPRAPSRAMLDAICAQADSYPQATADYAAMLAAAPTPPAAAYETVCSEVSL